MNSQPVIDPVRKASHELRGALSSVLGFSNLLSSEWEQISEDEKRQFAGIIERQARRMSELVDDLVSIVKDRASAPDGTHVNGTEPDS